MKAHMLRVYTRMYVHIRSYTHIRSYKRHAVIQ